MTALFSMIKRNCKVFFKDKGMFFTSLITPIILLVLYATFLKNVYVDSFSSSIPDGVNVDDKIINGMVGGVLISSLLAVVCVTVSYCTNVILVRDKVSGARRDFLMTPVKKSIMGLSYFIASAISTLIIAFVTLTIGLIYIACMGWFLSVGDVFLIILDVIILSLFGTAISSIINYFLNTNGQVSAVGTIVSAGYGFLCGAYMPISSFGKGLQSVLSFLPGTYGTSLIRNHFINGVCDEMSNQGFPNEVIKGIKDSIDCNLYFFDNSVSIGAMYGVIVGAVVLLIAIYILINAINPIRKKK